MPQFGALQGDMYQMSSGYKGTDPADTIKKNLSMLQPEKKEEDNTKSMGIEFPSTDVSQVQDRTGAVSRSAGGVQVPYRGIMQQDINTVSNIFSLWFGDKYSLDEQEQQTFERMVSASADPVDAAGRYVASVSLSKRSGLPVTDVYNNLDAISEYFTGTEYKAGDATLPQLIDASFETLDSLDLKSQWMDIVNEKGRNDPEALALEERIFAMDAEIEAKGGGIPKNGWDKVKRDVIGSLGYTLDVASKSAFMAVSTAATMAPMVGSVAAFNPIAGAAVTFSASLYSGFAGAVAGFTRSKDLSEAEMYWNLMHQTDEEGNLLQGNPETASIFAGLYGNTVGFMETMLDGITSRASSALSGTFTRRLGLSNLATKVLTDRGVQGTLENVAYAGLDWLAGGLDEGFLQEAPGQLAETILTAGYQKSIGLEPDVSAKEAATEFFRTGLESTLVGLIYGAVGIPGTMINNRQLAFDLRREANRSPSAEVFFERTESRRPENVSKEDFDSARTTIHNNAQVQREAIFGKMEGTVNASQEIAAEERYDTRNPETGEETATAIPDGSVYRTPDTNSLYTETREENGRRRVYAGDRNTGAVYGYAEVSSDGDTLTVDSVRVRPGYEGIREELVRKAISEQRTGESNIAWEPETEGLRAVREQLVQNNPRGREAGLDYGADFSISQDHDIESLSSQIRTAMPRLSREESVVAARLYSIADADGTLTRLNEGQPVRVSDTLPERYRGAADGARAIIYAGQNADFSTFYHELFHMNATQRSSEARVLSNAIRSSLQDEASKANLRKFIEESKEIWGTAFNADEIMQHLETISADSDASQWSRAQFEDLARLAEAYATADNSKRTTLPEAIRNILRKIGEYMRKVYQTVSHAVPLPKEITEAYDAIMHKTAKTEAGTNADIHYQEESRKLSEKYSSRIENPESWKGRSVREFFREYRADITEAIREYPKVKMDGVLLFEGMSENDMPFQKELLQSIIASDILGSNIILLPRFGTNFLNEIFGVELRKGSLADGLAALTDGDRYIEFKAVNEGNLIRRLNEASKDADIGFIVVDELTRRGRRKLASPHSQLVLPDGFASYVVSLSDNAVYVLSNKNKELSLELLADRPERISTLEELSSTLKEYIQGPQSSRTFEPISYDAYIQAGPAEFVNQGLVFQDSHVPDMSDLTEAKKTKRNEAEETDARYVDGDNTDIDSFYDGYDSSMDSIGDAYDAEEMARIYSEWAVDADAEASNANASLIDEEIKPFWNDDETNLLPDGSRAENEAEYENAINGESIPAQAEEAGLQAPAAPEAEMRTEAAADRRPGISLDDAEDYELSWRAFTDRNKPDISYDGTDAQKDDQFISAIQDDDTLLRYLGIIGEALYLNTRELNEDWHFNDQIQRERIKSRVFDTITNTSVRNASLIALKAELRGHDLTPRMKTLVRKEMSDNARFYRNILSFMIGDAAMKPEELIKDVKGLDIPSRDTLDAMPITELRALAETAEDKAIVDQIERGTLKANGGEDEKRADEINKALTSLKNRIKEQESELRRNEQTISQLESDLDSVTSSLEERDSNIDNLTRTLRSIEGIVQGNDRKLTGENLERYVLNDRMKKIAEELTLLSTGRYEEIEAQHLKGKKGKYEIPRARTAAREEYISNLTSFYPSIFEENGDKMGKLSGIRDIYSPSGFDKVQEVLEKRREELRAEWKNEASSYASKLANATWASARKLSSDIDSAIEKIEKLNKEIEKQKKLKDNIKGNQTRQIFNARTEERWKASKAALEAEKRYNQEIQGWKSYAQWQKHESRKQLDAVVRKARDEASLLASWMKAKADVRISELKKEQREKRREERLYKRIRAEKEKLGRAISRPVNLNTVDYETSAEAIIAIQAIVDPVFRRDWMYNLETNPLEIPGGDTMTITDAIAYLSNLQEDDRNNILSVLSPDLAARLTGERNPLNDWSISELRQLAEEVQELRRRGREVLQAKKAFERETRERIQRAIISAVREAGKRKGVEPPDTLPGTQERVKQSQSMLAKFRSAKYITMRMQELAQLLDGGLGHQGAAYQLLVDEKRYHQSREWRAVENRMNKIAPLLTKEVVNSLFEEITIQFEDGYRHSFTMNELAYIFLSQYDEDTKAAVAYGNLLTDTEKGTITNKGRLDENGNFIPETISPGTIVDDDELKALGDRRYAEAQKVAWEELDKRGLIPLVDEIRADFADPENFRRLNKASIEAYNTPLKRVQNYLPIMRTDLRGENFRNDMADALLNLNTGDFNAALDKGMTIQRIKIAPRHQRGVNLSLLEVWQKSVRNQEHLIEYAQYAKKLKGVFGSNASELVSVVDKVYSPGLMNEIQSYIDIVVNPYSGQPKSNLDKTLKNLRGRTGAAYLGWKLPGVVLQFYTSAWPFLQDISLASLLKGYLKLASGRGEALNMIYEKSPMMKHRTMNTIVQEALERRGDPARSKAGRAMDKFNEIGQLGLTWVDKVLVAGGWLGAYETALQRNLDAGMDTALADAAAVKTADDIVLRVQPAGDVTELPSLFRSKNELVKIFLQFQSSMSVIWNNLIWDNIGFARNRQFGKIITSVVAYGMAGIALGLVADGFDGDDDDAADRARKLSYWFLTQGVESAPVFGSDISMILQRAMTGERDYYGNGTDMFPGITKIFSGIEDIVASDKPFMEGLKDIAYGVGIFTGAPVSGLKNLKRLAEEGPVALLGR